MKKVMYRSISSVVVLQSGYTCKFAAGVIVWKLSNLEINIQNACEQLYNSPTNMSGKYSGLQAYLNNLNHYMDYSPCTVHSLKPVEVCIIFVS